MLNQLTTIAKKLKNLCRGRQSGRSLLQELRAMRVSYSQFGEDLVILNHFSDLDNSTGRFIDVGAYHPFKYSNTMLLSKLGWRGINIDCDQAKMRQFDSLRPGDENVCAAVADASRDMIWIEYPSGLTNRLADSGEKDLLSFCGETPSRITPVKAMTLSDIIEHSAFRGRHFHYLNIDCEGQDLSVLKGLNFSRYQPDLITVEAFAKAARPELTDFLERVGYELTDIVHVTLFFKKYKV
jgi:hypothetical protein